MNKYLLSFQYLKKYTKKSILIVLINLISSVFEGFSIGMLIPVIQSIVSKEQQFFQGIPLLNKINFFLAGKSPKEALTMLILFVFIMVLLKNIFTYMGSILLSKLKYASIGDFRSNLFNKIIYCSNKYYDTVKSGHLISNMYYETIRMGSYLNAFISILVVGIKTLVYAAILALVSWKFSVFALILILSVFPFIQKIIRKVKTLGEDSSAASSKFNFVLLEVLSGIRVVKSFGTEDYEIKRFKKADKEYINSGYKYEKYNTLISPLTETVILSLFVIVFFIIIKSVNTNLAALVPYAICLVLLNRAINQINLINTYRGQLVNNLASFKSYKEIEDNTDKFKISSGSKIIKKFGKDIEFKNVNFSYVDGYEVLKNINIKIPKGKTTAIVGATGSGKSTLVNLIPRFYDVTEGEIIVDGIPIKELDLKTWRKKIGIVSQDVFIFNATVRENIKYGNFNISDEEVEKAAIAANADEFIKNMPDGYDTVVGERGVRLSGGQKQRISIARAIINNPEILILDEATSSMDTKTERLIQDAVDNLAKNRTVIAIAHRLSTIQKADEIIVLEKGAVVEAGKHAKLLQSCGHYKMFYDLQFCK